jgi:arylsulfatase A-like enzyme
LPALEYLNGQSAALVYLYDLFPTLCELARIAAPADVEGQSLVPVMLGEQPRVRTHLFAAYRDCQRMVRDEHWKRIWYPRIQRCQLFDLERDPWETDDLSSREEHAVRLQELQRQLAAQQRSYGDDLAPPPGHAH